MPSTKTPRKGKPGPVSYPLMFPANAAQNPANARARVAVGDKGVQKIVDADVRLLRNQSTDHHNP